MSISNTSTKFWEETLAFSVKEMPFDTKEFKRTIAKFRCMMRKMFIISNNYFSETERTTLQILSQSAFPAADVSSVLGVCQPETYRLISYVKVLLREYFDYFEKKTYKELGDKLYKVILFEIRKDAGPKERVKGIEERADRLFATIHVYAVFRNTKIVAHVMNYSPKYIKRVLNRIDGILKKYALHDQAIKDLFIAWRRVGKIRKTAFGWYEKSLTKEYIEHGGRVISSIRKKWKRPGGEEWLEKRKKE